LKSGNIIIQILNSLSSYTEESPARQNDLYFCDSKYMKSQERNRLV